ncbi:MAG: STM4014 family protein [Pirellulaceae bacterium]
MHWIVGDSASRRYADYRTAAQQCGMPTPVCVDWLDIIVDGVQVLDRMPLGSRLRIDSFGQRCEVLAALIRHGGGTEIPEVGEIRSLDRQHNGIRRVLMDLSRWSMCRSDVTFDQNPLEILLMFDKWATHARMLPHRPDAILLPTDEEGFNDRLHWFSKVAGGRVFVKPRYASSASGVCCYRVINGRHQLIAPIEIVRETQRPKLFNSLRVQSFTKSQDVRDIFRVLGPQGMIAEAAVNKARVEGDRFDLRYVVIDGRADHLVVRQSASPITNLHLGNRRGNLSAVIDAVGPARLESCRQLAIHAARCFPETLYCGVDILLPQRGEPLVCEVNAFGDFLPNLIADGMTVYQAILKAGYRRREVFV